MTFNKISETIERIDDFGGHFLMRQLQSSTNITNDSDKKLIQKIIESKFHFWMGEEGGNRPQCYGFYDAAKIKYDHYKIVSFDQFKSILFQAIEKQNENEVSFINRVKKQIENNTLKNSIIYFLNLNVETNRDMIAEFHPYTFFYGFLAIDKLKNTVTLMEFGQD